MKILYFSWDEITENDILDVFNRKGYNVDVDKTPITDKLNDIDFAEKFLYKIQHNNYDCVFSFNFYPIISKVCEAVGIKYISWSFDSPCMTLYTEAIFNTCNYIFVFDRTDAIKLHSLGVENVYHMPLAVNTYKLEKLLPEDISSTNYQYDVSFVGKTYNDHTNFFDQIKNIPDYYTGYFKALIDAQMDLFGFDLASGVITEDSVKKLNFVNFNTSDEILLNDANIFTQILQKKITSVERPEILQAIADTGVSVTHFAPPDEIQIEKVKYAGYVNYDKEMPLIFRTSKINLNITLRSIISGIPLRCLDIMGAGGFLLSNYQPELAEHFIDGKEMVLYTGRDDLLSKIQYYLNHEDERIAIALGGYEKIKQEFSYDIILDKIMGIVF